MASLATPVKCHSLDALPAAHWPLILDYIGAFGVCSLLAASRRVCAALCSHPIGAVRASAIISAALCYSRFGVLAPAAFMARVNPGLNGTICGPEVCLVVDPVSSTHWMGLTLLNREHLVAAAQIRGILLAGDDCLMVPDAYFQLPGVAEFVAVFETSQLSFPGTILVAWRNFLRTDSLLQVVPGDEKQTQQQYADVPVETSGMLLNIWNESCRLVGRGEPPDHDALGGSSDSVAIPDVEARTARLAGQMARQDSARLLAVVEDRDPYGGRGPDGWRNLWQHWDRTCYLADKRSGTISLDPSASLQELLKALIMLPEADNDEDDAVVAVETKNRAMLRRANRVVPEGGPGVHPA